MRGVTLDEIAESTKIRRSHLEALEKEDFRDLPGGVFNKGFVRAYARFIGIDEDQAVSDYATVSNEISPPEDQFPLEVHEKPDRELNPRNSQLPLIGSVVALVIVVAGYVVYHAKHHQPESVAASVSAATRESASQPTDDGPSQGGASSESATAATKVVSVKESVTPHQPEKQVSSAAPVKRTAPPDNPLSPEHSFFIIIKAKEDAWISVMADGRRVSHGILKADKQRFIRAARQIVVKTGNAGGIDVSFNGRPLGAIGNESEARTLMFTPTGAAQQ